MLLSCNTKFLFLTTKKLIPMKKILTLLLVSLFTSAGYSQVVISNYYVAGGNSGAAYKQKFVELHNTSDNDIDLNGYIIWKRGTGSGNFSNEFAFSTSTIIPAGGYYLVASPKGTNGADNLPVVPDATASTGKLTMSASNGSIAITKSGISFTDCTTDCYVKNAQLVDLVGYGSSSVAYDGAKGSAGSTSNSMQRRLKGNLTTNNNSNDFVSNTVAPKNSSTSPFKASNLKDVVIRNIYTGSNISGSTYLNSFVELRNNGSSNLDISGFSLQYGASKYGSTPEYIFEFPQGTIINKESSVLIQTGKATGATGSPIPTPDLTTSNISTANSSSGMMALSASPTKLDCDNAGSACPVELLNHIEWGTSPLLDMSGGAKGIVRKNSGCKTDGATNQDNFEVVNAVDMVIRNGSTPSVACPAVPLQLSSFSAQKAGSNVQLKWSTAQEQNSKEFVVERSADQSNWSVVTTVSAANNSNGANYAAEDRSPAQGTNYYRLKMVDNDGSHAYSDIKSVVFSNSFAVSISPNPASTFINVTLSGSNGSSRVMVSDINGKIVYNELTTAPKLQISTSNFARGMYIVKVINGNETLTNKVIVQ